MDNEITCVLEIDIELLKGLFLALSGYPPQHQFDVKIAVEIELYLYEESAQYILNLGQLITKYSNGLKADL